MSRSTPTRKPDPILDIHHVLTFGKYKGESIADIMEINPQYLLWLHDNSEFFELGCELYEEVEIAINPNDAMNRKEIERAMGRPSEFID